jgi:hypothetical protein
VLEKAKQEKLRSEAAKVAVAKEASLKLEHEAAAHEAEMKC